MKVWHLVEKQIDDFNMTMKVLDFALQKKCIWDEKKNISFTSTFRHFISTVIKNFQANYTKGQVI